MMKQPVRQNLSDFIKSMMGKQFVIPVYQRKYTWTPHAETGRFMNDIEAILQGKTNSHFLGILIYLEQEVGWMFQEIQIVDGQQRLTTAFIFLLALRKIAQEENEENVAGMIDDYYLFNKHANYDAKIRLKPSVVQDDVYAKLVYGNDLDLSRSDKDSSVYRNYEYICKRLKEFHKKYALLAILDTLTKLDILAFPLSKHDNAQEIFESINSSGAPLTSADLIRNYIFMNDSNDVQERYYHMYWKTLEKQFPESRRLEEFFRYYLSIKSGSLSSRRDIYEVFKKWWNHTELEREKRLREINRYCRYFHELYEGPSEDEEVEAVLKEVRVNESRMPAPFLMEMYRLYDEGLIEKETLLKQLRLIDSYLTRRSLCGMPSHELNRYFPQLLRSVMNAWSKNNRDIHEITKVFLINYNRNKALAMPSDAQLRSSLLEINAYSLLCIRSVLERIEHDGARAAVDTSNLNIEHIMPQHPSKWWIQHADVKGEEEYTHYANLIGNLTLCAEYDNAMMGNEDFAFKKNILAKTMHIRLNNELLKKETWNVSDIVDRSNALADRIISIYPYMGGKETGLLSNNDDVIVMNTPSVNARAIYHNAQSIEIMSGTSMKAYGPQEMKSMRETYRDMVDNRVIYDDDNGQMIFDKNFRFHDLNTAAQFLLHRGGDNTGAWLCENGTVFIETLEEKTKADTKETKEKKKQVIIKKETTKKPKHTKGTESKKHKKSEPNPKKVEKEQLDEKKVEKKQTTKKPVEKKTNKKPTEKKTPGKKKNTRKNKGKDRKKIEKVENKKTDNRKVKKKKKQPNKVKEKAPLKKNEPKKVKEHKKANSHHSKNHKNANGPFIKPQKAEVKTSNNPQNRFLQHLQYQNKQK